MWFQHAVESGGRAPLKSSSLHLVPEVCCLVCSNSFLTPVVLAARCVHHLQKVVCEMQHAQRNPMAEHPDSHCYNRGPARSHLVPMALLPRLFYCLSLCPGSVTCRCCLQEGSVTRRCCLQEGSVTCRCCLQEGSVTCRCCLQEGSVTCRCCLQEGSLRHVPGSLR